MSIVPTELGAVIPTNLQACINAALPTLQKFAQLQMPHSSGAVQVEAITYALEWQYQRYRALDSGPEADFLRWMESLQIGHLFKPQAVVRLTKLVTRSGATKQYLYPVDFTVESYKHRVAFLVDGMRYHFADEASIIKDRGLTVALQLEGWTVVRCIPREVSGRSPELLGTILTALGIPADSLSAAA